MKIVKRRNIFLCIVFLCAIYLPLIFSDKSGGQISTNENRKLAEFPAFQVNGKFNPTYTTELESWINDNLGFKRELVAANKLLYYSIFKEYPGSKTVVGKNDWLFLAYEGDWANVQHADIPSEEELLKMEQNLKKMTSFLKQRECESAFIIWPNKITAYRENFPDSIYTINEKSRIEVLEEKLTGGGDA